MNAWLSGNALVVAIALLVAPAAHSRDRMMEPTQDLHSARESRPLLGSVLQRRRAATSQRHHMIDSSLPLGFYDGTAEVPQQTTVVPALVSDTAPLTPSIPTAAEERASVETTPEGVTIVRGPGSRHIAR